MKKKFRVFAVLLCALMLSLTLCSCIQLDDLKENRGFFTDESKESFVFKDHTYRLIKIGGDVMIDSELYDGVITTEDVPLLLSDQFGYHICYNEDEEIPTVIRVPYFYDHKEGGAYGGMSLADSDYYTAAYFCLDTKYDELKNISDNAIFDCMYTGYTKQVYKDGLYDYQYVHEMLPDDFTQAIDAVIKSNHTKDLSYKDISGNYRSMTVNRCDRDMLISKRNSAIEIIYYNEEYYISAGNTYDSVNDYYFNDYIKVPEEYKELFRRNFDDYYEKGAVYDNQNSPEIEMY